MELTKKDLEKLLFSLISALSDEENVNLVQVDSKVLEIKYKNKVIQITNQTNQEQILKLISGD
jgi:hypothetical protein